MDEQQDRVDEELRWPRFVVVSHSMHGSNERQISLSAWGDDLSGKSGLVVIYRHTRVADANYPIGRVLELRPVGGDV